MRAPAAIAAARRASKAKAYPRRQSGASLFVALIMLIAVLLLGLSGTRIALQSEKAARNDRDRQVALQAAEAALMDAELDIEGSPDAARSRSAIFGPERAEGFSADCAASASRYLGLCLHAPDGARPAWQMVDFLDDSFTGRSVAYGRFTGQSFQTGTGMLPARLPRYIIELMSYNKAGEAADLGGLTYFYRVTAIGFGARESTQVVLQTFYRKGGT